MSSSLSSNGYVALIKGGNYTGADGESTSLAQKLFNKCIINYFQHDEFGWLPSGSTLRKSSLTSSVIRPGSHTRHQPAMKISRHTQSHVIRLWISISLISKCICCKVIVVAA